MARQQKNGLDYFPLNVDIDQDDKIQLVEAEFGIEGFGVIIRMFMKIYKEGYYYKWTEKEQLLFSRRVNVDINRVNVIINSCLKWGLFDKNLFEKTRILSSKGIQRRYLEAVSRRKNVEIIEEYCLVDTKTYSNIVFVNINTQPDVPDVDINPQSTEVDVDINPQSKVKESKAEKKKKIYKKKKFTPPTLEEVKNTANQETTMLTLNNSLTFIKPLIG